MIIEQKASDLFHVPLADLRYHDGVAGSFPVRSFSSSEQLIDWVKKHPGEVFIPVRDGALGEKLPRSTEGYSLEMGDVLVGDMIVYDNYGLRKPGLGTGGG